MSAAGPPQGAKAPLGGSDPHAVGERGGRILIVKLSSLGDVVHAMPAVQDLRRAFPNAQIDWVVERAFAPLVTRCEGVHTAIPCELRKWRKTPFAQKTRAEWRVFKHRLQAERYDGRGRIRAPHPENAALFAQLVIIKWLSTAVRFNDSRRD